MSYRFFASILLTLLASANAGASDYLLKLETTELSDLPNGAQEPDSRTRETIEILVHSGRTFFSRTQNGKDKVLVNGKLEEASDGKHRVQVSYRKSTASGETVPVVNGQRLPVLDAIELKTELIDIQPGKAVEFDFNVSRSKKIRAILTVNNFDPSQSSNQ